MNLDDDNGSRVDAGTVHATTAHDKTEGRVAQRAPPGLEGGRRTWLPNAKRAASRQIRLERPLSQRTRAEGPTARPLRQVPNRHGTDGYPADGMTALAVRCPKPSLTEPKSPPRRLRPLPPPPAWPIRPAPSLRERLASDRDLVGLKVRLLVGLGLLAAALEIVL